MWHVRVYPFFCQILTSAHQTQKLNQIKITCPKTQSLDDED